MAGDRYEWTALANTTAAEFVRLLVAAPLVERLVGWI